VTASIPFIAALLLVTCVVTIVGLAALRDNILRRRLLQDTASESEDNDPLAAFRRRANMRVRRTDRGSRLDRRLAGASIRLGPADFITLIVAAAVLVVVLGRPLLGNIGVAIVVAGVVVGANRYIEMRRRKRVDAFVAQLPELARVLSNAASAGLALRTGVDMVVREMPAPASQEFGEVSRQLALGQSLQSALAELSERLPSRELAVLIQTLVIQSRAGGGLVAALSNIASTLEERKELQREVRTSVSGAVFGGYTVVAIGVGAVIMMNVISPGALDALSQNLLGQIVLLVAGVLFAMGFFLIRRITKIDI
jgi:tight adherence protein B